MKITSLFIISLGLAFTQISQADATIAVIDCGHHTGCQVDATGSDRYPYQLFCSNGKTVLFKKSAYANIGGKRVCAKVIRGRLSLTCTSQSKRCR